MSASTRQNYLRERHGHTRVTYLELFFDLVFVFAITQLSHALLADFTWTGAAHTAFLFIGVWWAWIYTTWITNWLDPERTPVRLMLLALMLAGLLLSSSIPHAFDVYAIPFACAYVFIQVGRTLFMLWALGDASPSNTRNFQRILVWLCASAAFWLYGAFADQQTRNIVWLIALAIEFAGPSAAFWAPGLGRSSTADWDVEGAHMAERCALFIIIALGESILVTGATFAELEWTQDHVLAFVIAFAGSVAMWWIYFDEGAERASDHITKSADPGRIARVAYTYIHALIVAGIVLTAVGDEFTLAHPAGHAEAKSAAAVLAGPALYLLGVALFKAVCFKRTPLSHVAGIVLLGLIALVHTQMSPLAMAGAAAVVLVAVAVWETFAAPPAAASQA